MRTQHKLLNWDEARKVADRRHKHGEAIALATGCFDGRLHNGHIEFLEHCSDYGCLFVGINSDEAVRELKGSTRPIHILAERMRHVAALHCVHLVFPIDSTNVAAALRHISPTAWFKGGDYTMETLNHDEVATAKDVGAEIVLLPKFGDYSTTTLLQRPTRAPC